MLRRALLLSAGATLVLASAALAFPPIDMTVAGATAFSTVDGTFWHNLKDGSAVQPAGTGIYDPFLREQATGNGPNGDNGVEYGMNTDGTVAEPLDNVGNDPHTHSVQFGDLAKVTFLGVEYYVFSLDLNEPSGGDQNFLSLDRIKIYSVNDGAGANELLTEAAVAAAPGGTLHYDMDGTEDQTVWLDYNNSNTQKDHGSGVDDLNVFIPTSFFAGVSDTDYMYFLANFGAAGDVNGETWTGDDGFEEWRVLQGGDGEVPEPGTIALLGVGLLGLAGARRRS